MNKGLTVIELMIIIAIIAIIAAIAIPALQRTQLPKPVSAMLSKNNLTHQETWRVPRDCVPKFQGEHPNYVINSVAPMQRMMTDAGGTEEDFIYVITKIELPAEAPK